MTTSPWQLLYGDVIVQNDVAHQREWHHLISQTAKLQHAVAQRKFATNRNTGD